LESHRKMTLDEMEREMTRNRQHGAELERLKLEINMEKAAMEVDKKNMKADMDRLTALGHELRKQASALSEAQHNVVQERMKNEMLKVSGEWRGNLLLLLLVLLLLFSHARTHTHKPSLSHSLSLSLSLFFMFFS